MNEFNNIGGYLVDMSRLWENFKVLSSKIVKHKVKKE